MIERHLVKAESDVTLATEHVRRQRELVGWLEAKGHVPEPVEAGRLLATFEESLRLHIEQRDRVSGELRDHDRRGLG